METVDGFLVILGEVLMFSDFSIDKLVAVVDLGLADGTRAVEVGLCECL